MWWAFTQNIFDHIHLGREDNETWCVFTFTAENVNDGILFYVFLRYCTTNYKPLWIIHPGGHSHIWCQKWIDLFLKARSDQSTSHLLVKQGSFIYYQIKRMKRSFGIVKLVSYTSNNKSFMKYNPLKTNTNVYCFVFIELLTIIHRIHSVGVHSLRGGA